MKKQEELTNHLSAIYHLFSLVGTWVKACHTWLVYDVSHIAVVKELVAVE